MLFFTGLNNHLLRASSGSFVSWRIHSLWVNLTYLRHFTCLATTIYVFVAEIDLDRSIRKIALEEKKTGATYFSHTVRERTHRLQELVAILFGAVPIFAYIAIGQFVSYNDAYWIPYAYAIPATISSLIFARHLHVSKFEDNGAMVVAKRHDTSDLGFIGAVMFPIFWPLAATFLLTLVFHYQLHDQSLLLFEMIFPMVHACNSVLFG